MVINGLRIKSINIIKLKFLNELKKLKLCWDIMAYKIDNAIIKKDKQGNMTLIDPENYFKDEKAFIAIKSDDLISIQILINCIINNDFKRWKEIPDIKGDETVKSLFVRLGYTKEDIAILLKEF